MRNPAPHPLRKFAPRPFLKRPCRKSSSAAVHARSGPEKIGPTPPSPPFDYPVKQQPLADLAQPAPEPQTKGPQTFKLTLAYDGTDFRGWQVQPGEPTIQGELQAALGRITGETPLPQGSGRTDAGVHALAQVASFALRAPIPPENLLRALNRTLPPSIRISEARAVRSSFHARHSALAKTYEYRILRAALCPPFLARYVYACPWPLDFALLEAAARLFVGEHDFQSFAAGDPDLAHRAASSGTNLVQTSKAPTPQPAQPPSAPESASQQETECPSQQGLVSGHGFSRAEADIQNEEGLQPLLTTVRTVYSSAWEQRPAEPGELLVYRVRGNGFLHHMVRNLVGTMLDVARGHLALDQIPAILAARSRSAAGPTAPARGLFLHSVEYDERDLLLEAEESGSASE